MWLNPVMPASGTFAEGLARVFDLDRLGALVTKTITRELRMGNPLPRVAETHDGMLNAIGIPSKGVPYFLKHILPEMVRWKAPLVVSISAPTVEGFAEIDEGARPPSAFVSDTPKLDVPRGDALRGQRVCHCAEGSCRTAIRPPAAAVNQHRDRKRTCLPDGQLQLAEARLLRRVWNRLRTFGLSGKRYA